MPGAFSHFMIADLALEKIKFSESPNRYIQIIGYALTSNKEFVDLGAVGPDFPYLDIGDANSKGWANAMHYCHTADFVKSGVEYFANTQIGGEEDGKMKAIAWLFGYASHVVADLAIHRVLKASGFDYAVSQLHHRECELHQDAYIYQSKKGLGISQSEFIKQMRKGCVDKENPGQLEQEVVKLWITCLQKYPLPQTLPNGSQGPTNLPCPSKWFNKYTGLMDRFVEESDNVLFILKPVVNMLQVVVPKSVDSNSKFVKGLKADSGLIDYEALVDKTVTLVLREWEDIAAAISGNNLRLFGLSNGNLDTGLSDELHTPLYPV